MSTSGNEPGGIRARRIEADNVVAGVQMQGGDAQTASSLIQLAQAIQQGQINADEIKARNLVSGLQYIADPAQASVEDLRRELLACVPNSNRRLLHESSLIQLMPGCDREPDDGGNRTGQATP